MAMTSTIIERVALPNTVQIDGALVDIVKYAIYLINPAFLVIHLSFPGSRLPQHPMMTSHRHSCPYARHGSSLSRHEDN